MVILALKLRSSALTLRSSALRSKSFLKFNMSISIPSQLPYHRDGGVGGGLIDP